jgi:hypothetical protein
VGPHFLVFRDYQASKVEKCCGSAFSKRIGNPLKETCFAMINLQLMLWHVLTLGPACERACYYTSSHVRPNFQIPA